MLHEATTTPPQYRLRSAHIFVNDLPAAKEYYVDKMEMTLQIETPGFLLIDAGEASFMIFDGSGGGDPIGVGTGLHFGVEDIDALFPRLRGRGVNFLGEPVTQDWGGRMVSFVDPSGNVLHLVQYGYAS